MTSRSCEARSEFRGDPVARDRVIAAPERIGRPHAEIAEDGSGIEVTAGAPEAASALRAYLSTGPR